MNELLNGKRKMENGKMENERSFVPVKRLASRRWLLIIIGFAIVVGASLPPFEAV